MTSQASPQTNEAGESTGANIMVVDDDTRSLQMFETALRAQGYRVRSFPLGRLALAAAAHQPPDLILLDVNMPELTGYEVCQRLKDNPALVHIPVIFLTGRDRTQDKVEAFRCGGVDHVSKPVQIEEVYARVKTHLHLRELQRALERHNERLEATVAERTRELAEAHARLTTLDRAKSDFLTIISHELRTPLNGLLGVSELAFEQMPESPATEELVGLYQRSRERILSLIEDAMLLTRLDLKQEAVSPNVVALQSIIRRTVEGAQSLAHSRSVVMMPHPLAGGWVIGEEDLLVRAVSALLEVAVKFTGRSRAVLINTETSDDTIHLNFDCHTSGISSDALSKLFDVFGVAGTLTPGGDLGLGPALARKILSLFGASVVATRLAPAIVRIQIALVRQA